MHAFLLFSTNQFSCDQNDHQRQRRDRSRTPQRNPRALPLHHPRTPQRPHSPAQLIDPAHGIKPRLTRAAHRFLIARSPPRRSCPRLRRRERDRRWTRHLLNPSRRRRFDHTNLDRFASRDRARHSKTEMLTIPINRECFAARFAPKRILRHFSPTVMAETEQLRHPGSVLREHPELSRPRTFNHRVGFDRPALNQPLDRRIVTPRPIRHRLIPNEPRTHLILRRLTTQRIKASMTRITPSSIRRQIPAKRTDQSPEFRTRKRPLTTCRSRNRCRHRTTHRLLPPTRSKSRTRPRLFKRRTIHHHFPSSESIRQTNHANTHTLFAHHPRSDASMSHTSTKSCTHQSSKRLTRHQPNPHTTPLPSR